jgi:hypothetical protein
MAGLILANESAKSFTGKNDMDIANAVASALSTYVISTPSLVQFTLSGTVGPVGQVTSIVVAGIVPQAMAGLMFTKAASLGLRGKNTLQLFQAISNGVCTHLQTMQVTGTTAGLAVGGGVGRFTFINKAAVKGLLQVNFLGKLIKGKNAPDIIESIAFGFTNHMKSAPVVSAVVAGAIAPVPPAGPVAVAGIPTVINKII